MKLFPTNFFSVELRSDYSISKENLISNTDITDSLTSDWTNKEFRGQVNEKGFKLISSEIGRGAVCVLIGKFDGKIGEIEIRIHNAFKVMFSILMLMPIAVLGVLFFMNDSGLSSELIIPLIIGVVVVRFVFMELIFRITSSTGINKLIDVLTIKELKKR